MPLPMPSSPPSSPPCSDAAAALLPALTQQLHRFFLALDDRRYDGVLALFTDDCRWLRQGVWLQGKAAVLDGLEARPLDMDTCHLISNACVTSLDGDAAVLQAWMTAYRTPRRGAGAVPQAAGPLRLNFTTTHFRRDAGHDWRIAEQRLVAAVDFTGRSA